MKPSLETVRRAAAAGKPQAQFHLGVMHFTRGDYRGALPWVERAAAQQWAEAQNLMALMALNGFGIAQNVATACEQFRAAAAQDLKEAHYNLAGLLFNGLGVPADAPAARAHLKRAAELGHAPALRSLGFVYSQLRADTSWQDRATRCFLAAAGQGDALAQHALGVRYLKGLGVERDLDAGIYWFAGAARRGMYSSQVRLARLRNAMGEAYIGKIAARTSPANAAGVRQAGLDLPDWDYNRPDCPAPESSTGPLSLFSRVLDEQLCEHLINVAAPRLSDSQVIDPDTGESLKNTVRTSRSMTFGPSMYDIVIGMILQKLAAIAGLPVSHAEPLAVLQYKPGQEYKPHFDYFVPTPSARGVEERPGGARIVTAFAYLNGVAAGGATDFPRLQARVRPERGRVVKFLNYNVEGEPDKTTLHAGLPVERGEKWLATFWFHQGPIV